jgi:hypothetical protein
MLNRTNRHELLIDWREVVGGIAFFFIIMRQVRFGDEK